ncbi:MAG TPA: SusD/RagB family nutrient-binding outer membrane lipoprotein [Chitinophagaceae bacterium]|nr:SusD/RagB family nutrient-binding outer membrane lipoprotein [Chitinophagaceae bacterium]
MKTIYLKIIPIILSVVLVFGSCKKTFLDVNTNPNTLPTASPNFVFTNALNTTVGNLNIVTGAFSGEVLQNETGSYFAAQWTQSSSYILNPTIFAYTFTNGDFNYFDGIYNNLEDYQYVIDNADANEQKALKGPAKVMKAYLFQKLVDMYGNVPFSEALQGVKNIAPKFDDQKMIYESLIPLLDSALIDLKANAFTGALISSDIVFSGSNAKWARFANSLKLRILIRQSRISGRDAYITTEIKKAVAEGSGFIGAGEDVGVNPGYQATAGKLNPFYERFGYTATGTAQAYNRFPKPTVNLFNELISRNDTLRLKRIAYAKGGENPNTPGVSTQPEIVANYVGIPYGVGSGYTAGAVSSVGPAVLIKNQFNRPLYLMIAAESQFLLSEAVLRYGATLGLPNTAQQYYEQGVRESFRLNGVPNSITAANALLTGGKSEADWLASPDKFKAIWLQKWLAFVNFEGFEAWTEVRRTNYPVIPLSASSSTGKAPVRFFYPSTELGSNKANVDAQGTIDVFNTRLFWDVD